MGTAERKEREKQQRKRDIIDAAERVFLVKGFEQTTMDDVAKEVELSKGTLYLYFKSKEELFFEILKKGEDILSGLFNKAIKKKMNGLEKVKATGKAFIKFHKDYSEYHEAFMYDFSKVENIRNDFKKIVPKSNLQLVEALQEGIEDGSIRKDIDPIKTALLLWGQAMGILQILQKKGDAIEEIFKTKPKDLLEYFFEFTHSGLKA